MTSKSVNTEVLIYGIGIRSQQPSPAQSKHSNMYGKTVWKYTTRIFPALSVVLLLTLLVIAFVVEPFGTSRGDHHRAKASVWQWLLSAYTLFLHVLSTIFPLRALMALGNAIRRMKATSDDDNVDWSPPSSGSSPNPLSEAAPESDWIQRVVFAIIIPAYKEDEGTLKNTLQVLAAHPEARFSYHVSSPYGPVPLFSIH